MYTRYCLQRTGCMHHPVTAKEMLTLSTHLGQQVCTSKFKQYWVHFFSLAHIRCRTYTKTIGLPELLKLSILFYRLVESMQCVLTFSSSDLFSLNRIRLSKSGKQYHHQVLCIRESLVIGCSTCCKKGQTKKTPMISLNFF